MLCEIPFRSFDLKFDLSDLISTDMHPDNGHGMKSFPHLKEGYVADLAMERLRVQRQHCVPLC